MSATRRAINLFLTTGSGTKPPLAPLLATQVTADQALVESEALVAHTHAL